MKSSDIYIVRCILVVTLAVLLRVPGVAYDLISNLPLNGSLDDLATGRAAGFTRESGAYTNGGTELPANAPRFEQLAVASGYQWDSPNTPPGLVPLAIIGSQIFATDDGSRIYVSTDGETFTLTYTLDGAVTSKTSAFVTPTGALLLGGKSNGVGTVWRSGDGGQSFDVVLLMPIGYPMHWNYTALGPALFVSEYGNKHITPTYTNARKIYRSDDDGLTWQLVYDPPPEEGHHNHRILADPWRRRVYQSFGDNRPGILASDTDGSNWQDMVDYYQPTSGIARADAIYWGHDGQGVANVARYEPDLDRWTQPLRPWKGFVGGRSRFGDVFTMLDYNSVIYAPFMSDMNEVWASADGVHWAFLRTFNMHDVGVYYLAGTLRGWVHARYVRQNNGPRDGPDAYLRFRPGRVATFTGLRIEPPADNLLANAQSSSAEVDLTGWDGFQGATLTWDTSNAYQGQASVRFEDPNDGSSYMLCPALPASVPVGTYLRSQIHTLGHACYLRMYLYDEVNHVMGPITWTTPCDEWTTCTCELLVTQPNNSIRLLIGGYLPRDTVASVWLDGYQITAGQTGRTWQLGGTPRAGETLVAPVALPAEWTDFLCFTPDFDSSDADLGPATIKAWVQDGSNYAWLEFDPGRRCFQVLETRDGQVTLLAQSDPVMFWLNWTCRIGVRSSASGCELRVKIGATELIADGAPLSVQPSELWIGSHPAGDAQAPGVYALSRTFNGPLSDGDMERELDFVPPGQFPGPGDCNCDGVVDFQDIDPFVLALTSPEAYYAQFPQCDWLNADCNGDGNVDFADIDPFVVLLTGP